MNGGSPSVVRPRLQVLTDGQIEAIHTYSLRLLSETGVRVDSERALEVLRKMLGPSAIDGDRVRIPAEAVEWAIRAAPSTVEVYGRDGDLAFRLGADRTRFGIGVTALYYQDPADDHVVPFARQHMAAMVRLGHNLPYYDAISTVGILRDLPPEVADLYAALEMVANTTKPLIVLVSEDGLFPRVLDLLESLAGGLSERPFVVPYFNPVSPLVINRSTIDKMFVAIERGLPFIYSNYGMAGATVPITAAGMFVLMNAELLAGLVLAQSIRESTPVILGSLPAFFDMRDAESFYDPQSYVVNLACAEMMAHYGLPHAGTSGSGPGWRTDLVAAGAYWINHVTACIGKVGLAPFVGDNLGSKAFSPTNVVFAHEVIIQALRFADGFPLDDGSVGLEEVRTVGPGGNFLTAPLTLKHFRHAYYSSPLFPRWGLEKWQAEGRPRIIDRLREYTLRLIDEARPPDDHDRFIEQGEQFIAQEMRR